MKKFLSSFGLVVVAGKAMAHESGLPHTHFISTDNSDAFVWSVAGLALFSVGALSVRLWQKRGKF